MKLLIVRHADPDYSVDSLTEVGFREAELLSDRLTRLDVKAFYCSPLGRARATAKPTLSKLGREAEIAPWLREFPAQIMKPNKTEASIAWDWLPADWTSRPEHYDREKWYTAPAFKDTNIKELIDEVYSGLDEIISRHGYERQGDIYIAKKPNTDTVVLFCHFGLECVLLSHLLGVSPMPLWHGTCALPSSVTTLVTEERREGVASFRMLAFGDTSHLYAAGAEPSFSARFCETFANKDERHD